MLVTLEGRALPTVPCSVLKVPLGPHGWNSATTDPAEFEALCRRYPGAPYIGVATGARSGLVVIDIDRRNGGFDWLESVRDRLPTTRVHGTGGRGLHFLHQYEPGLRCRQAIVPGVDFRANGGGIVWWPAAGLDWIDEPVARLGWLREFVTEGIGREMLEGEHPSSPKQASPKKEDAPPPASGVGGTQNLIARSEGILSVVKRAPIGTRNARLFWASCRFAEMVAEGAIQRWVAERLLEGAARDCGLMHDDGVGQVRATIASGLRSLFLISGTTQGCALVKRGLKGEV